MSGLQRLFENFHYFSTFWNYPYEWDWTDGDVYGQVDRLRNGLPLYMDLNQGLAYTAYPPLYPYLIQGVDSIFGENTPVHARQINLFLLIGVVFLFYFAARRLLEGTRLSVLFFLIACSTFTLPLAIFNEVTWARTSTTCFFLGILALIFVLVYESKITSKGNINRNKLVFLFFAGFFSATSVVAKQHGALICVTIALHLFFKVLYSRVKMTDWNWKPLVTYVGFTIFFLGIATLFLEIKNQGNFIEVTFISMGKSINIDVKTEDGTPVRLWSHSIKMLSDLYEGQPHYFWLTVIGCLNAAIRKKWTVIHSAFLTLLLLIPYLATSIGSGPSYYWPLWWVVCVLSTSTLFDIWFLCNSEKQTYPQRAILVLCLLILMQATRHSYRFRGDAYLRSPNAEVEKSMKKTNAFIQRLVLEDPSREFLLDRYTGPLYHADKPFLVETCLLYHGYLGGAIDITSWVKRIERQEFYLITTSRWLNGIKEVREAIEKNYRISTEFSKAMDNGRRIPVAWVRK